MDKLKNYYLELANRVCEGVTPDHYDKWLIWAKENSLLISPWMFIATITTLDTDKVSRLIFSWHMEHGKRVDDKYHKIKLNKKDNQL